MKSGEAVLRVGIDDAPPVPMQMGDPALGNFRGYEVDLLEQIAERLSCRIEYHRAWWSRITEELTAGNLDMVCSAATVTEERKQEVSFCEPHLQLRLALVTREETAPSRFGVRRGTTAEAFLRTKLALEPVMLSESNDDLYQALSEKKIDAIVDDSPIARHFAGVVPELTYRGAYEGTEAAYAIMLAKDSDPLRSRLNSILRALEAEGVLASMRERWFGRSDLLVI